MAQRITAKNTLTLGTDHMLDVSALYGGIETPGTPHRYGRTITQIDPPEYQPIPLARSANKRRPIVVWNITRTCNLKCVHCYTSSDSQKYEGELTTKQCLAVIDDLAAFNVPAVLFSGGEPLLRHDIFELTAHARKKGLHVVLSTNGTLIVKQMAHHLKKLSLTYVGISLDSAIPEIHDKFRGCSGAFEKTMSAFRHCVNVNLKVGLRLTLTQHTCRNIDLIFDLIEAENINRACFYHLCPAGRGKKLDILKPHETRQAIDYIFNRTRRLNESGNPIEVLTVDNHCDGAFLYLKMLRENHPRTGQVLEMLQWNGGGRFSSGVGIANIDHLGNVHADQFSMFRSFGNVLNKPFSKIWLDTSDPIMAGLKNRLPLLKGRCRICRFRDICGGSLRARAEIITNDPWAADPACYLTDDEITGDIPPPTTDNINSQHE